MLTFSIAVQNESEMEKCLYAGIAEELNLGPTICVLEPLPLRELFEGTTVTEGDGNIHCS